MGMKLNSGEIYLSADVETDGPIPGEYSMLSLGAVAFSSEGEILGKFYRKLKPLPRAKQHPEHMKFWKSQKDAWEEVSKDQEDPKIVMNNFFGWLSKLKQKTKSEIIFVGWPISADFMWVTWYLIKFVEKFKEKSLGDMPYKHYGIDIDTFAMASKKMSFMEAHKNYVQLRLSEDNEGASHKSIDDALRQGLLFIELLKENKKVK